MLVLTFKLKVQGINISETEWVLQMAGFALVPKPLGLKRYKWHYSGLLYRLKLKTSRFKVKSSEQD